VHHCIAYGAMRASGIYFGWLKSYVDSAFVVTLCLECEFAQVVFNSFACEFLPWSFEVGIAPKGNFSCHSVVDNFIALAAYQLIVQSQLLEYYW